MGGGPWRMRKPGSRESTCPQETGHQFSSGEKCLAHGGQGEVGNACSRDVCLCCREAEQPGMDAEKSYQVGSGGAEGCWVGVG